MMLTTVPGALRATMSATAACIAKNGARRLIATCASNNSGVVSSSVPRVVSPAALTRQSIRPQAATTCSTLAARLRRVGQVGLDEQAWSRAVRRRAPRPASAAAR